MDIDGLQVPDGSFSSSDEGVINKLKNNYEHEKKAIAVFLSNRSASLIHKEVVQGKRLMSELN